MRHGYAHPRATRRRVVAEARTEHSEENALSAEVSTWSGIVRWM